jgi:hypothetical protein
VKLSKETSRVSEIQSPADLDGEIYVRFAKKPANWRLFLLLAALTLSVGGGVLASVAQLTSVPGSTKYAQSATECPGMTPTQKAAAQAEKR